MESVFISSSQVGFARIRTAVAAVLEAFDLRPLRAETAAARTVSSRRAMLDLVGRADLLILILGEIYGAGEGEVSPTEEEFNEAVRLGRPVLVLVQEVTREEAQEEFLKRARGASWAEGRFSASFKDESDVGAVVVKAILALKQYQGCDDAGDEGSPHSPPRGVVPMPFWNANPRFYAPVVDIAADVLALRAAAGLEVDHWLVRRQPLDAETASAIRERLGTSALDAWLHDVIGRAPEWRRAGVNSARVISLRTRREPTMDGRFAVLAGCGLELGGAALGPHFPTVHLDVALIPNAECARLEFGELVASMDALLATYVTVTATAAPEHSAVPLAFGFFLESGSQRLGRYLRMPDLPRAEDADDRLGPTFDLGSPARQLETPEGRADVIRRWCLQLLLDRGYDITASDVASVVELPR
jgi:hypothetical protein